ncbi:hypothetical protein ACQZ61_22065 [Agrobacterium vitis]|nr:hypothetical protein RvVAR031_pl04010 [Agrobacterium vitis]
MDKQRLHVKLDQHLNELQTSLLEESYRPQPAKRIYIPKSDGKRRPLGIPTMTAHRSTRHVDSHGADLGERIVYPMASGQNGACTMPSAP